MPLANKAPIDELHRLVRRDMTHLLGLHHQYSAVRAELMRDLSRTEPEADPLPHRLLVAMAALSQAYDEFEEVFDLLVGPSKATRKL